MLLQAAEQNPNVSQPPHPSFVPPHVIPNAPHSAPANIVFQNIQSPYPLPSPAELEFDEMSPLTSPWLGAYNTNQSPVNPTSRGIPPGASSGTKRRTASPGSDEMNTTSRPSRKRQAAASRVPQNMPSMASNRRPSLRGTKSASSTPLFPAASGRNSGGSSSRRSGPSPGDIPGDTPSPVDLSMPPPATPQPLAPMNFLQGSASTTTESTPAPTPQPQEHITPVTPASIMNLGRLGSHAPVGAAVIPPPPQSVQIPGQTMQEKVPKPRSNSRPRSATVTSGQTSAPKGMQNSVPIVSPALKPIRPGASSLHSSIASY